MSANVLIVEDETAIVDFLRDNLMHDEHRVTAVGTARDAIKALGAEHFDVALVDVGLPDGPASTSCARSAAARQATPASA